ncbi:MAG TPA: hypothetical protein VG164_13415 [Trebonia sp.]|jgi:hypothetical protein|nr:hypothetical protein [Trebonia sp.]
MVTKVAPGDPHDDPEITSFAIARWDRTARLCAIRLSETLPTVIPLVWVMLHR